MAEGRQWAQRRHPDKKAGWQFRRYWRRQKTRMGFSDGKNTLICYVDTPIVRHVKVKGDKSPYDGDWVYWVQRLGRDPTKASRGSGTHTLGTMHLALLEVWRKQHAIIERMDKL